MQIKITFFLLLIFSMNAFAESEAIKCFQVAWEHPDNGGLGLTKGQAVKLCGGTPNVKETIQCYVKA